jgi:AcrR family transcriptional regulator
MNMLVRGRVSLLDVAAEVLVADPGASLAEVAEAAGIGRTTLHKHFATRDDLIRAVGLRALDLWEEAVAKVPDGEVPDSEVPDSEVPHGAADESDGGLGALISAMIPIGPQLAFLWRTPAFDHDTEFKARWGTVEERGLDVLRRGRATGILAANVPDWWLLSSLYSLIYCAAESLRAGRLAPLDAPGLVLRTFLHGIGGSQ